MVTCVAMHLPRYNYFALKIRISQNTPIYCQYVSWQLVSTIYSHHQAILNHISVGILSGSAHVWDPKNVYRMKTWHKTVIHRVFHDLRTLLQEVIS